MASNVATSSRGQSSMETDPAAVRVGNKRSVTVDPDTNEEILESKRPKIQLDGDKKIKCLKAMLLGFDLILRKMLPKTKDAKGILTENPLYVHAYYNLNVSIQITNIIFTLHTIERQKASGRINTNILLKSAQTDFTVTFMSKDYNMTRDSLSEMWIEIVTSVGLVYKDFRRSEDEENWYGTFGPYIDFFCGFGLRLKELRMGHGKMPITKRDGVMVEVPVSKYGLNGAHHVLLEGCTFPPEKRSSMAQSVGPMTAFLCMLRSDGIYRAKWAAAVKRAFNHIPIIDDIIEVTKMNKRASDIATMTGLLAEILMITTSRQATRMFFPIAMLHHAMGSTDERDQDKLLKFFNTTGSGGFFVYKKCADAPWNISFGGSEETAGQIVFHSIFGTYKEDLGILSEITNVANWRTREEMGKCFVKDKQSGLIMVKLPQLQYYSKMSCANQSGLLTGVYNQVSSIPAFSGSRIQFFGADFFQHIEKKTVLGSTGKTLPQIVASLSVTLEDLRKKLNDSRGTLSMGTTNWRKTEDLDLDRPGSEVGNVFTGKGIFFMGRSVK